MRLQNEKINERENERKWKKMKVIKVVANKKDWLIFEIMHMIMISGKIPFHLIYGI